MSNYNFMTGQPVLVTAPHNHFQPSSDTIYHVGSIGRIQGSISVQLLLNGVSVGAVPQDKLKAK